MMAAWLWLVTLLGVSAAGFCTMWEITKQYLNKIIQSFNHSNQNHSIKSFNLPGKVWNIQGVPKKIGLLSSFEFLGLGGVFLGVKNNSKNFGNKKNIGLFSKILRKWTLFVRKIQKILCFYEFMAKFRMENFFKWHKS